MKESAPTEPDAPRGMRIDKWLWAVRLYKTRSLAIAACQAGHVKIKDQSVKPAREIRPNDIIEALTGYTLRTVKVLALLDKRVGAKLVPEYMQDLTPPEVKDPKKPDKQIDKAVRKLLKKFPPK